MKTLIITALLLLAGFQIFDHYAMYLRAQEIARTAHAQAIQDSRDMDLNCKANAALLDGRIHFSASNRAPLERFAAECAAR